MDLSSLVEFIIQYLAVAGVYSLLAISMNIEYGWAGIPNFGKAAFMAVGGAVAAVVATQIGPVLFLGLEGAVPGTLEFFGKYNGEILPAYAQNPLATWGVFILSAIVGGVIAALLGILFTYPAVRLKEDYLAIALLMSAQLIWIVLRTVKPIMGGTMSLILPSPDFKCIAAAIAGETPPKILVEVIRTGFIWLLVIGYLLYVERQMGSPFGRKLRIVRDDEVAAEAYGKNVSRARLEAMIIGSFLAGIAGAVYALVHMRSVNPDNYLPDITFMVLTMVLVGGVGNNVGSIVGGMVVALVDRLGYMLGTTLAMSYGVSWGGYLNYLVYGVAIMLAIFFRPQGLLPEKPVKTPAWKVYVEVTGRKPVFLQSIWTRVRKSASRVESRA
ncbi:MAG TPA: branched-chain amino acid ABC transporter permease [Pyrodictium sp.]|nr:branched-chain amino acid ABC transporter permease [Pyrodictium sp.]